MTGCNSKLFRPLGAKFPGFAAPFPAPGAEFSHFGHNLRFSRLTTEIRCKIPWTREFTSNCIDSCLCRVRRSLQCRRPFLKAPLELRDFHESKTATLHFTLLLRENCGQ